MSDTNDPTRHYGTDSTDQFETIVEATTQEDGTVHLEAVVMEVDADPDQEQTP